jgi:hypothetical protein
MQYCGGKTAEISNKVKGLSGKTRSSSGGARRGGGSSAAAKKEVDEWKEAFETAYEELGYLRDRDLISEEDYYRRLNLLNEKYFRTETIP